MGEEKIVMFDSDEAAQIKTVEGWFSRNGHFWGKDEHGARWDGCTHVICDCGKALPKHGFIRCKECLEKLAAERYAAKTYKEWNGSDALYSDKYDRYFFSEDELDQFCQEMLQSDEERENLRLVICEPALPHEIDPLEYYSDLLPDGEEGPLPGDLEDAFKTLNEAIRNHKEPLSWTPGKYAAAITWRF